MEPKYKFPEIVMKRFIRVEENGVSKDVVIAEVRKPVEEADKGINRGG